LGGSRGGDPPRRQACRGARQGHPPHPQVSLGSRTFLLRAFADDKWDCRLFVSSSLRFGLGNRV